MRPPLCFQAALLALFLALAGFPAAASPDWPPPEEVTLDDDDLIQDDAYAGHFRSRYWYFNAALLDGTELTMSVFQWRYGSTDGEGLMVLSTESGAETFALETKLQGLEVSGDRLQYRFGESVLEGDREGASIRLRLPEFSCDLTLRNLLNPWKPGDGYTLLNRRGDHYTRLSVTSPLAEVSGSLEVEGRWRPAEGWAYAERGIVAMPMSRINPEQSAFRVFGRTGQGEPMMLCLSESSTHRAYGSQRVATLLLARGGQWLMASSDHDFQAEDYHQEAGAPPFAFPHRFRVRASQDGRTLEGEFTVSRLFYVNDILKKLPPGFRAIAEALIRRPIIYRLEGEFSGTLEEADGSRESLELRGQGEYQLMH